MMNLSLVMFGWKPCPWSHCWLQSQESYIYSGVDIMYFLLKGNFIFKILFQCLILCHAWSAQIGADWGHNFIHIFIIYLLHLLSLLLIDGFYSILLLFLQRILSPNVIHSALLSMVHYNQYLWKYLSFPWQSCFVIWSHWGLSFNFILFQN